MITSLLVGVLLQIQVTPMPIQTRREIRDTTRNYIVIHNDGANMNAYETRRVLLRRRLAYHYFIERTGKVYQYVDPRYIASHAGNTLYGGFSRWNDFSIGVCLQGRNGATYTDKQYESLQLLINRLQQRYSIPGIVSHSEIAFPQGRKHDPGETFDLTRIIFS
jgi:N-acetyl-anhydromuramyl-L-alanine amidase AmpD